jgi:hypothetical protein
MQFSTGVTTAYSALEGTAASIKLTMDPETQFSQKVRFQVLSPTTEAPQPIQMPITPEDSTIPSFKALIHLQPHPQIIP